MVWQIRTNKYVLSEAEKDAKTVKRYMNKISEGVEPQLLACLAKQDHICGPDFSAVDCLVGHNILWSKSYGLCQDALFGGYLSQVSKRPAFLSAFADAHKFESIPPKAAALSGKFTG